MLFETKDYSGYTCYTCVSNRFHLSEGDPMKEKVKCDHMKEKCYKIEEKVDTLEKENIKLKNQIVEHAKDQHTKYIEDKNLVLIEERISKNVSSQIEKLKGFVIDQVSKGTKSYAATVKETGLRTVNQISVNEFKSKDERLTTKRNQTSTQLDRELKESETYVEKEELFIEENDRRIRSRNFIIHAPSNEASKDDDENFVSELLEDLGVGLSYEKMKTLSNTSNVLRKTIKVVMRNENEKDSVLKSLRKLKNKKKYDGVSITDDYTIKEREIIKKWHSVAQRRNNETNDYFWIVRGNPKTGMDLIRTERLKLFDEVKMKEDLKPL